jgi:hypothetical protein
VWKFGVSRRKSSPQPQAKAGDGEAEATAQEAVKAQVGPTVPSQGQQPPPQPQEAALAALEGAQGKKAQEKTGEPEAPKLEQKAADGDLLSVFVSDEVRADPNAQKLIAGLEDIAAAELADNLRGLAEELGLTMGGR